MEARVYTFYPFLLRPVSEGVVSGFRTQDEELSGAARGGTRGRVAAGGGRLREALGGRGRWAVGTSVGCRGPAFPGAAAGGGSRRGQPERAARGVQGWSGCEGSQNVHPSPAEVYFGARLHYSLGSFSFF